MYAMFQDNLFCVPSIDSPRLRVKERYGVLPADWGSGLRGCGSLLLRQRPLQLDEARQEVVAAQGQVGAGGAG
jgi:hypothetical protein